MYRKYDKKGLKLWNESKIKNTIVAKKKLNNIKVFMLNCMWFCILFEEGVVNSGGGLVIFYTSIQNLHIGDENER